MVGSGRREDVGSERGSSFHSESSFCNGVQPHPAARNNSAFDAYILSSLPVEENKVDQRQISCVPSMSHAILGQSHLLDLVIRESAAPVRQVPGPRTGPSALDHAKGRNTRKSCDRCRRHKTKCDEGRPCRRCASKTIGQLCLDCDSAPDDAVWHDGSASTMVPHAPEFQSKAIVLPDQIAPLRAPTKSEIFAEQFGRGVWVNHNTSRKIVDGMPDELLEVVMESLEALRICKVGFCKENGLLADAAPKHSKGMVLKVLDDDYCADPVCVEEIYIGTCRTSGIFFNRRFAQEIMGCSADELLTRLARGDVGFSMTELESLCLLMDTHL